LLVLFTRRARALAYAAFYGLPHAVRRRIVRVFVRKYIVGGVCIIRDSEAPDPGRILLLRQPPGRGWGLPAGLLHSKEPPVVGAARELAEETGVRIRPRDLRPALPNAIVHAAGWVDMVFEGFVPASSTELVVDGAEVWDARWFSFDDLPRLSTATARVLAYYGLGPLAAQHAADQARIIEAAGG
jgi:8-oxo-dGTP pyrophosphatase MutT (NUDIX family)